jgi:hypothetical protein
VAETLDWLPADVNPDPIELGELTVRDLEAADKLAFLHRPKSLLNFPRETDDRRAVAHVHAENAGPGNFEEFEE